ncbi:unnamed protein product [Dibothriocephalus latus]|uniref:Uncharacterized protein n=1 Tax=Dibothriocephalus latus TaxID=60516 RepID=A0A3P7R7S6_DIBLA|nr:unnamed protein product [Dibothriocephalus latus]
MLSIRSTLKVYIGCTTADLVFRTSLRLPGEFNSPPNKLTSFYPCGYKDSLRSAMCNLRAMPSQASLATSFPIPFLDTCKFELVQHDAVRPPIQPPYKGPNKAV